MTIVTTSLCILTFFSLSNADSILCDSMTHCANGTTQQSYLIQIFLQESYRTLVEDSFVWTVWSWLVEYQAWIFSILGSSVVGLSGIFPLLVIPIEEGANLKTGAAASTLRVLLSFAVGGLLGDVFLHLLPEAWAANSVPATNTSLGSRRPRPSVTPGLWVLAGILLFTVLEMVIPKTEEGEEEDDEQDEKNEAAFSNGCSKHKEKPLKSALNGPPSADKLANGTTKYDSATCNGFSSSNSESKANSHAPLVTNGTAKVQERRKSTSGAPPGKQVAGYLNLLANSIDNFMHGLAVGGGFLVSFKMGALTTLAILIHEVPHEIGDFAILLRAGFSRWDAARAQLCTAGSGLLGALTAVYCSSSSVESRTSWVVPFTAGGFLHIALVTVLPELLAERDRWESAKQLTGLLTGVLVMALLTAFFD